MYLLERPHERQQRVEVLLWQAIQLVGDEFSFAHASSLI
ncbi:hypothetical protein SBA6_170024 [Candidatus Sulfopaludibacter sp. SbA6]|nr:hypothetical protein SBA6_170024 [Candidatus Sulfopaludibacter sp. SbA6]